MPMKKQPEKVNAYSCVKCQTFHYEGEWLYWEHANSETKDSLVYVTKKEGFSHLRKVTDANGRPLWTDNIQDGKR